MHSFNQRFCLSFQVRVACIVLCLILFAFSAVQATNIQQTVTVAEDTYLKKNDRNTNKGSSNLLKISEDAKSHLLVRFDQTAINSAIAGRTLLSAELQLYITTNWGGFTTSGRQVNVHRMTASWTEMGATWNCPIDTNTSNSSADCSTQWDGGTFSSTITDHKTFFDSTSGWQSFDVLTDLSAFLGGTSNFGWLIKKDQAYISGDVDLASLQYSDSSKTPKLVLTMINNPPTMPPPDFAPDSNQNGWNNNDVTVTFTCTDSDGCSCSGPYTVTMEGQNMQVTGTCTDNLGAQSQLTVYVNIDKTPPDLTASKDPESNGNGWNNTDVTIHYTATDGLSGIPAPPTDDTVTSESTNQQIVKSVEDRAGNSRAITTTLNIDKTPPSIQISSPANGSTLDTCQPTVSGNITEALSGALDLVCNGSPGTVSSGSFACQTVLDAGLNTVTVEAEDIAGNVGSASISLTFPTSIGVLSIESTDPQVVAVDAQDAVLITGVGFDDATEAYVDGQQASVELLDSTLLVLATNFESTAMHALELRKLSTCPETSFMFKPGIMSIREGEVLVYPPTAAAQTNEHLDIYANSGSFEPGVTVSFASPGTACSQGLTPADSTVYIEHNHIDVVTPALDTGGYDVFVDNPNDPDFCQSNRFAAAVSTEEVAIQVAESSLTSRRISEPISSDFTFSVRHVESDSYGYSHVRFDEYYKGLEVFGGESIFHVLDSASIVSDVTDAFELGININVTPQITADQARAIADEDLSPEGEYLSQPTAELVVFPTENESFILAYHVHSELENEFELRHTEHIIDAVNGTILGEWDSLKSITETPAVGDGQGHYNGAVKLNTWLTQSGLYQLKDSTRGKNGGNTTYNCMNTVDCTAIFSDSNNEWGDGALYGGEPDVVDNAQTAGVDAAYGTQKAWDYYKNVHLRNGIDGTRRNVKLRAHFFRIQNYYNAFWADNCFCASFYDDYYGDTTTSLDIVGHELSHGMSASVIGNGGPG